MALVAVDSEGKRQRLANLISPEDGASHLWTGGHDNTNSRKFEWISNSQLFDYTNWFKGEPNDKKERCVEMIYPNLNWNDVPCDAQRGYVCEEIPAVAEKRREIKLLKEVYENRMGRSTIEVEEYMSKYIKDMKEDINHWGKNLDEKLSQLLDAGGWPRNYPSYGNTVQPWWETTANSAETAEMESTTTELPPRYDGYRWYSSHSFFQAPADGTTETSYIDETTETMTDESPRYDGYRWPPSHSFFQAPEDETTDTSYIDETTEAIKDELPTMQPFIRFHESHWPYYRSYQTNAADTPKISNIYERRSMANTQLSSSNNEYEKSYFQMYRNSFHTPETRMPPATNSLTQANVKQLTDSLKETNEKLNILLHKLGENQNIPKPSKIFYNFY